MLQNGSPYFQELNAVIGGNKHIAIFFAFPSWKKSVRLPAIWILLRSLLLQHHLQIKEFLNWVFYPKTICSVVEWSPPMSLKSLISPIWTLLHAKWEKLSHLVSLQVSVNQRGKGNITPSPCGETHLHRIWVFFVFSYVWEELSSSNVLILSLVSSAPRSSKIGLLALCNCLRTSFSYAPSSAQYQNWNFVILTSLCGDHKHASETSNYFLKKEAYPPQFGYLPY